VSWTSKPTLEAPLARAEIRSALRARLSRQSRRPRTPGLTAASAQAILIHPNGSTLTAIE
jgi:hypothetical protein